MGKRWIRDWRPVLTCLQEARTLTDSMRVILAGVGVDVGSLSIPLTRFYAEAGSPGSLARRGIGALSGVIAKGDQVSEAHLQLLVGMGQHPVTGDPFGLAYPTYNSVAARFRERSAALDPTLEPTSRM